VHLGAWARPARARRRGGQRVQRAQGLRDGSGRYAACGVDELWVFDPRLVGPRIAGGPHRLQVWTRTREGDFARAYAGPGPTRSEVLDAWLLAVDEGRKLRISGDADGERMWLTAEERERAEKDRERAEKDRERAEKERLQRQVAELEARLRGG
jgi:hypothetical protein